LTRIKAGSAAVREAGPTKPGKTTMGPILVATDLSARSDRAVTRAAHLARATGAPLRLLHVADDDLPAALIQRRAEEAEAALGEQVAATPDLRALDPRIDVEFGGAVRMVARVARDVRAEVVVIGAHRDRGLADLIGTPTASRMIAAVEAPILVAVGRPERAWHEVVAGWDFSPAGEAALRLARRLAPEADLRIVHCWQEPVAVAAQGFPYAGAASGNVQGDIEARLRDAADALGDPPPSREVAIGAPVPTLARIASEREAGLICLGRHARSGFARLLLGDTAAGLALAAPCDVLIAPPA
jgi:nucleotide-binding universal stress UspA family protein